MALFLLIEWIYDNPKTWSVVPSSRLVDGTLRKSKKLVGKIVEIQWNKTVHSGLVRQTGSNESELNDNADILAEAEWTIDTEASENEGLEVPRTVFKEPETAPTSSSATAAKRKRATKIEEVLQEIDESVEDDADALVDNTTKQLANNQEIINWKEKFEETKTKLKELRKKYKKMKSEHKLCSNDDAIEISPGSNVKLLRLEILAMKTISSSITFFARNLFRRVFQLEDIVGRSLLGRKSTVVENHIPLPPVDCQKRDAVIECSLRTYGFELPAPTAHDFIKMKREIKSAKSRIIKSLSDFVREENFKAKKSGYHIPE